MLAKSKRHAFHACLFHSNLYILLHDNCTFLKVGLLNDIGKMPKRMVQRNTLTFILGILFVFLSILCFFHPFYQSKHKYAINYYIQKCKDLKINGSI